MSWACLSCMCIVIAACSAPTQTIEARDEPDRVVLANERLTVALGKAEKGGIVSLIDRRTGRELVAKQASPRLFTLTLTERQSDGKQRTYLSSGDAESVEFALDSTPGLQSVRLTYRNLGGKQVNCACLVSVREGDSYVRFRLLQVEIPDGLALELAQFPFVVLKTPLEEGRAEAAVIGHTKGGAHHGPSAWKVNASISAVQPGSLAAQFGCYYDDLGGFLTAAHDAKGYPKTIWMRRTEEGLEAAWGQACFASSQFAMGYDVVMTTFAGNSPQTPTDWREAADLYKAWAEKQPWCAKPYAEREDIPEWLKSGPAMVRFSREWLAQPDLIERWLNEYWRKRFPAGTPLIVAYWGWEKVAGWVTPDYFPCFPSDEVFRRLAQMNRSLGGHVFPWPSGYHYTLMYGARPDATFEWDDRERFARDAEPHAVVNRDGTTWRMKPNWLEGGETSCMCPGDPWTIDWFNSASEQLVERGADMVQVDQVVGGRFPACYSTEHGHPPGPGLWMAEVFRRQLETMLQRCREIDPQAVVCFEEPNEHFIQQVATQDYRDLEATSPGELEKASVFNYVYHEYLPTFQSNPSGDKQTQAYCLVNGEVPHFVPNQAIGPGPLLDNGGFEEGSGDRPVSWDKVAGYQGQVWEGSAVHDDGEKHSGQFSLRLENADDQTVQVSRNIAVSSSFVSGRTYRLSAWIKTSGLQKPNGIMLGTFTADWKSTGGWRIPMPQEEQGWAQGEATFTVPEGSVQLRIMLHLEGAGTAWIDDVVLEEVQADGTSGVVMRPEVPADYDLMHRWVELFAGEGRPYLLHGRMLHPPKLEAEGLSPILCNAFRAPDGSEAVIMVNASDEPQRARLTWKDKVQTVALDPWEVKLLR